MISSPLKPASRSSAKPPFFPRKKDTALAPKPRDVINADKQPIKTPLSLPPILTPPEKINQIGYQPAAKDFDRRRNELITLINQSKDEKQLVTQKIDIALLREIDTLNFSEENISPGLLHFIAKNCPNLQKLSLPIKKLENLDFLASLTQLTSLLVFENNHENCDAASGATATIQVMINAISKLKNLEHLAIKLHFSQLKLTLLPQAYLERQLLLALALNFEPWNCLEHIKSLTIKTDFPLLLPQQLLNEKLIHLEIHSILLQNNHLVNLGKAQNLEFLDLSECLFLTELPSNSPFENLCALNVKLTEIKLPSLNYKNLRMLTCNDTGFTIKEFDRFKAPQLSSLAICVINLDERDSLMDDPTPAGDLSHFKQLLLQCSLKNLSVQYQLAKKIISPFRKYSDGIFKLPEWIGDINSLAVFNAPIDKNSLLALKNTTHLTKLTLENYTGEFFLPENINLDQLQEYSLSARFVKN